MMSEELLVSKKDGPNQIISADSFTTSAPDGRVKLRIPESGTALETHAPISIPGLLERTATNYPDSIALCSKDDNGEWKKITYREYEERVRTCAKAFLKLGLERFHSVCILGFNSPEWFISDLAAIYAGGYAVGIYTTNSKEACVYCAKSSRANIIVVEDDKQLQKFLETRDELPEVKAIIQYSGKPKAEGVLSWDDLMKLGSDEPDDSLNNVLKSIACNECCTLVYTSGTVGNPKAVMLNHDNLVWDALTISERLKLNRGVESVVSYLPLSHVAAQVVDIYITMTMAAAVYFADKNALKGSLINTLLDAQPTRFLGVPRVWEKMHEKMMQIARQSGSIKSAISSWAKGHGLQHYMDKMMGIHSNSWGYTLASAIIFKKIKQALGLSKCSTFVTAAAPLSADIKKYFMSIDIPIMEAFGMSESAGAHTIATEMLFSFDSIGSTLSGTKTKIHNPDENGHGEICMYGRNIFMGYLNGPDKTREAIDDDGWLHSGDIGYINERGLVFITGRIKELLITAGGENVPPVPIEQLLISNLPHVSCVMLIGDQKKFLSVLITLKTDVDSETGAPKNTLTKEAQAWMKELGCPATTIEEVIEAGPHPNLVKNIQSAIDKANEKSVSNAQRIQKFTILPADFSVATGELGPTLKLKRNVITKKYEALIDKMYS